MENHGTDFSKCVSQSSFSCSHYTRHAVLHSSMVCVCVRMCVCTRFFNLSTFILFFSLPFGTPLLLPGACFPCADLRARSCACSDTLTV